MPFCPRCGDEVQPWVKLCPDCGSALTAKKVKTLNIKSTPLRLVTLEEYDYTEEAQLNKALLETHGIQSWVSNEKTTYTRSLMSTTRGGIKLKVDLERAEQAAGILAAVKNTKKSLPEDSRTACQQCGSREVRCECSASLPLFLSIFTAQFPLSVFFKNWRCRQCGHRWRQKMPVPD